VARIRKNVVYPRMNAHGKNSKSKSGSTTTGKTRARHKLVQVTAKAVEINMAAFKLPSRRSNGTFRVSLFKKYKNVNYIGYPA